MLGSIDLGYSLGSSIWLWNMYTSNICIICNSIKKGKTTHWYPNKYPNKYPNEYVFLTWVLQYVISMREILNKGGLNWGEPGPFALLLPMFRYVCVCWGTPAEWDGKLE